MARYPSIILSKSNIGKAPLGKPTSMAEALKREKVVPTPEWNVKVAGGKKAKKGAK